MKLDFEKNNGLIPVIVQEADTGEVLMLAYVNEEALTKTTETGFAHFYSRSRNRIWKKGEESGHTQKIIEIRIDCDEDTILYRVHQNKGIACHEGYSSCFFRTLLNGELVVTEKRIKNPSEIYPSTENS
ncbi:MAG TPA: phosphoribosyl-AMP cyclohydrolase [Spirochaetota bacterium]